MKKLIILLLLLPSLAWGACDGSFTPSSCGTNCWLACDASNEAAIAAINASEAGADWTSQHIVQIPAGTVTWATNDSGCYNSWNVNLCIRRGVKLQGGIGGTTTITANQNIVQGVVQIYPNSTAFANGESFEVTGFTFDSGDTTNTSNGIITVYQLNQGQMSDKLNIHNNTFKNGGVGVTVNGTMSGVVHSNIYDRIGSVVKVEGGDTLSWNNVNHHYTGETGNTNTDAVFFEDNILGASSEMSGHFAGTSGQGGSLVYRYNTHDFTNCTYDSSTQLWDTHGLQSIGARVGYTCGSAYCGYGNCTPDNTLDCDYNITKCQQWATVKAENYGNIITNPPLASYIWHVFRGKMMLMFNNYMEDASATIPYYNYSCDPCQDPAGSAMEVTATYQNTGDTITKSSHGLTNGTAIVVHSYKIEGTATGGSTTTLIDTSKNFRTLGVTETAGAAGRDAVYNTTDSTSGSITSLSTTTNDYDTLNISAGMSGSGSNGTGESYYVMASYGGVVHDGITTATPYYVVNKTDNTFQLATSVGGDPIEITGDGTITYFKFFSQSVQNTYVWNNVAGGNNALMTKGLDGCADHSGYAPITANTHYWNYNSNALNGSTQKGINCGSSAPALACSSGDGYWQTSYSPCTSVPATMADIKTYTQAGKFWKCTSPSETPSESNWTEYYTPYTYPHPLRGEGGSGGAGHSFSGGATHSFTGGSTITWQ